MTTPLQARTSREYRHVREDAKLETKLLVRMVNRHFVIGRNCAPLDSRRGRCGIPDAGGQHLPGPADKRSPTKVGIHCDCPPGEGEPD